MKYRFNFKRYPDLLKMYEVYRNLKLKATRYSLRDSESANRKRIKTNEKNSEYAYTNSTLYNKLKEHCKLYELFKLYSIQASTEIAESIHAWQKIEINEGAEKLKYFFTECLISREEFQKNTWHTALLRALINDVTVIL